MAVVPFPYAGGKKYADCRFDFEKMTQTSRDAEGATTQPRDILRTVVDGPLWPESSVEEDDAGGPSPAGGSATAPSPAGAELEGGKLQLAARIDMWRGRDEDDIQNDEWKAIATPPLDETERDTSTSTSTSDSRSPRTGMGGGQGKGFMAGLAKGRAIGEDIGAAWGYREGFAKGKAIGKDQGQMMMMDAEDGDGRLGGHRLVVPGDYATDSDPRSPRTGKGGGQGKGFMAGLARGKLCSDSPEPCRGSSSHPAAAAVVVAGHTVAPQRGKGQGQMRMHTDDGEQNPSAAPSATGKGQGQRKSPFLLERGLRNSDDIWRGSADVLRNDIWRGSSDDLRNDKWI